jgi:hypothetical protein
MLPISVGTGVAESVGATTAVPNKAIMSTMARLPEGAASGRCGFRWSVPAIFRRRSRSGKLRRTKLRADVVGHPFGVAVEST